MSFKKMQSSTHGLVNEPESGYEPHFPPCPLETPKIPNKSFFISLFDQFCSKKFGNFKEENFPPLKTCNRSHVR